MNIRDVVIRITGVLIFLHAAGTQAAVKGSSDAIIIIGSSYANNKTRLDDSNQGSLLGLSVGSGSYFSLGDALIRNTLLNGLVINEANVGSTTFNRFSCLTTQCLPFGQLLGYEQQFENALKRVAIYSPESPQKIIGYNAKFVIISMSNDCIHSDAFGIPQQDTQPCSIGDIYQSIDTIIRVVNKAEDLGLKVILPLMPAYKDLELILIKQGLGFTWVANEEQYNLIASTYKSRLTSELNNAYVVNIWKKFTHRGDGIHPNYKTANRGAKKIARLIKTLE